MGEAQGHDARIAAQIAEELGVRIEQVLKTLELLDGGATVPFIARYRKELTGGLDDTQLRNLEERLGYLRELEQRRETVLGIIQEQGKLTPALEKQILEAASKTRLEDLYLPYKKKRRTKAMIAREAGLEPLAEALLADPMQVPEELAAGYVSAEKGVEDAAAALEGARYILCERFAEDADLLAQLREYSRKHGLLQSKLARGKEAEGAKFADWFDHVEPIQGVPSHRALAMLRGRKAGVLSLRLGYDFEADGVPVEPGQLNPAESRIAAHFGLRFAERPGDAWMRETLRFAWKTKLSLSLELDAFVELRTQAEEEAIQVFGRNLGDLLLAAPAGQRATLGLDPGLRTGTKVAVVDATGKVLDTATIYPHAPRNDIEASLRVLSALAKRHRVELIAVGNGTASRETERLVRTWQEREPELGLHYALVSEAGASVYSASELAANEFPELDVSLRGAVSIARRLQDPLAELVKIDPKSIGVGQYQHDVNASKLARKLDAVVEDCVNSVGVDLNTASAALLSRVAGLGESLAQNIVKHRDSNGAFPSRKALLKVARLGPKAFEQSAGFLRVRGGEEALDASAVHPEAYELARRIARENDRELESLIGDSRFLRQLDPSRYTDQQFGLPTVQDILSELDKPGRDPRPAFEVAKFADGVEKLEDLVVGEIYEGVVSNVANFGAFVDLGVHQDGLVHISRMSHDFVNDPRDVVKAGQVVRVRVLEIDLPRQRVSLSLRLDDEPGEEAAPKRREAAGPRRGAKGRPQRGEPKRDYGEEPESPLAAQLRKLGLGGS
ncbi:MAG: RNA-binding transcriptional accessory protein [Planctomycetota bacterium]|nr:MAG: RNA-binding transcriptional accessory protein [Planctomycetota bacterium]